MSIYQAQWDYLYSAWQQERHPQAMLFVGALNLELKDFIKQLTTFIFCKSNIKPCNQCQDCQLVLQSEHPDIEWIKPEKSAGPIKIEQIRDLQNYSYLTPQRAKHRLIIIESADRMNIAAANALLKILEEPASHTLFLLLAQQLSTVLPTIISRCQMLRFTATANLFDGNLLALSEQYPPESEQAVILGQAEVILEGLIAVIEQREHPSVIAAQWIQFELNVFLWFFYLVYAQVYMMSIKKIRPEGPAKAQLEKLVTLLKPLNIFTKLDKINALQRKLSHNMNVNHTLALEDLLFE